MARGTDPGCDVALRPRGRGFASGGPTGIVGPGNIGGR